MYEHTHVYARTLCISADRDCYRAAIILRVGPERFAFTFYWIVTRAEWQCSTHRCLAGLQPATDVTICSNRHSSEPLPFLEFILRPVTSHGGPTRFGLFIPRPRVLFPRIFHPRWSNSSILFFSILLQSHPFSPNCSCSFVSCKLRKLLHRKNVGEVSAALNRKHVKKQLSI